MKPWWNKKWGSDAICGITQTRLRPGFDKNNISRTTRLSCSHRFYTLEILEWAQKCPGKLPTCPLCRQEFTVEDFLNKISFRVVNVVNISSSGHRV
jgi:hypothetical protein